jgi:hypothetical protein
MATTSFKFEPIVDLDRSDIISCALGAAAGEGWDVDDVGKLVTLEAASADANYNAIADGGNIEGFITSVEAWTVNGGFKFGSIQRNGRVWVINADAGALAVGDYVCGATQTVATGTAGKSKVKKATGATLEALNFKWRVIRLAVAGAIGDEVLIERV